jgi:hypothetical protein
MFGCTVKSTVPRNKVIWINLTLRTWVHYAFRRIVICILAVCVASASSIGAITLPDFEVKVGWPNPLNQSTPFFGALFPRSIANLCNRVAHIDNGPLSWRAAFQELNIVPE